MLGIKKDVKMPVALKRYSEFPLTEMEVGDSFVVPASMNLGGRQQIASSIQGWKIHSGCEYKFKTALVGGEVGVWRIA